MPNNSAFATTVEENNYMPEEAMSFEDYWKANNIYGTTSPSNQLMVSLLNMFTGEDKRVKNEYQTYLDNLIQRNEYKATQSARAYETAMANTQNQRAFKDLEAAGINPYLLLNSGSVQPASISSAAKASYDKRQGPSTEKKNSNTGSNIGMILLGVARLIAALV